MVISSQLNAALCVNSSSIKYIVVYVKRPRSQIIAFQEDARRTICNCKIGFMLQTMKRRRKGTKVVSKEWDKEEGEVLNRRERGFLMF